MVNAGLIKNKYGEDAKKKFLIIQDILSAEVEDKKTFAKSRGNLRWERIRRDNPPETGKVLFLYELGSPVSGLPGRKWEDFLPGKEKYGKGICLPVSKVLRNLCGRPADRQ